MNNEQRSFFRKHKIPKELTYNANGLPIDDIKDKMELEGKAFAYNTTPCEGEGHTIIERSGHCVQCNTKYIALMIKSISYGCVYIAGSVNGALIKIGYTRSKEMKSKSLDGYGDCDDWEILYSFYCIESVKMEDAIQTELKRYSLTEQYNRDGHLQKAKELFKCGYPKAKEATQKVQQELNIHAIKVSEATSLLHKYNFRNLVKE